MATAKEHGFDAVMNSRGIDELFAGHKSYFFPFFKSLWSQWMFKDLLNELLRLRNANISCNEILTNKTIPKEFAFFNKEYKHNYTSRLQNKENKLVLNDYLYESYTSFLPSFIHCIKDNSTNFGMDCLQPFSNSKALSEYVFSVPSTFKIHNGWNKYLLRASMVGIVPDEIRWGKQKSNAYAVEKKWLNEAGCEIKKQISQLEDENNFINKQIFLNKWDKLYKTDNFYFQQFAFRYYSYLVWWNEIF
jgi:asparagine synthase (glutamine-hydrolysing)